MLDYLLNKNFIIDFFQIEFFLLFAIRYTVADTMSYFIKVQRHNAMQCYDQGCLGSHQNYFRMETHGYNAIWGVVYPEKSFKIMDPLSSSLPPNERTRSLVSTQPIRILFIISIWNNNCVQQTSTLIGWVGCSCLFSS